MAGTPLGDRYGEEDEEGEGQRGVEGLDFGSLPFAFDSLAKRNLFCTVRIPRLATMAPRGVGDEVKEGEG